MNANRIRYDGFSNPDTEAFYQTWTLEQQESNEGRECGLCACCFFPGSDWQWILCLNIDGPCCYETVSVFFSCPRFKPREKTGSAGDAGLSPVS